MFPKRPRLGILPPHHEVNLYYSHSSKGMDDPLGEGSPYPLTSVCARYGEVLQITTPAVSSTKHRPDKHALLAGNKTEPGITQQVEQNRVSGIRFSQGKSLRGLPEGHHLIVISRTERGDFDHVSLELASVPKNSERRFMPSR